MRVFCSYCGKGFDIDEHPEAINGYLFICSQCAWDEKNLGKPVSDKYKKYIYLEDETGVDAHGPGCAI